MIPTGGTAIAKCKKTRQMHKKRYGFSWHIFNFSAVAILYLRPLPFQQVMFRGCLTARPTLAKVLILGKGLLCPGGCEPAGARPT